MEIITDADLLQAARRGGYLDFTHPDAYRNCSEPAMLAAFQIAFDADDRHMFSSLLQMVGSDELQVQYLHKAAEANKPGVIHELFRYWEANWKLSRMITHTGAVSAALATATRLQHSIAAGILQTNLWYIQDIREVRQKYYGTVWINDE